MPDKKSLLQNLLAVSVLTATPVIQADPFDGFFAPGERGGAGVEPVQVLFEDIARKAEGTPAGHAREITGAVDERVAAMQIFEGKWFSLDWDLREVFVAEFPEGMRAHMETLGIDALHVKAIGPGDSDSEFAVKGFIGTTGDDISVTWTVRVRGNDAQIIRAETPEGTLLLPPDARELAAGDEVDLKAIMEKMGTPAE